MSVVIYLLSHFITALFFTGLVGCVPVVLISWFSILKSEFSTEDRAEAVQHEFTTGDRKPANEATRPIP